MRGVTSRAATIPRLTARLDRAGISVSPDQSPDFAVTRYDLKNSGQPLDIEIRSGSKASQQTLFVSVPSGARETAAAQWSSQFSKTLEPIPFRLHRKLPRS
jgi:hypothetical protein